MTLPDPDSNPAIASGTPPDGLSGRLRVLHDRIAEAHAEEPAVFASLRNDLEGLEGEARSASRHDLTHPLARLALLTEVWECLALERPDSAAVATDFCRKALEHLASAASRECDEVNTAWILEESSNRWSDYLGLIDSPTTLSLGSSDAGGDGLSSDGDDDAGYATATGGSSALDDVVFPPLDAATLLWMLTELEPSAPTQRPGPGPLVPRPAPDPDLSTISCPREGAARTAPASVDVEIDPEFCEAFSAEALDLFERIESLVLGLGRGTGQQGALHELGRCLHTLKGAAGSVGLTALASEVHHLEQELEDAGGTVTTPLLDELHEMLAHLEVVLDRLRQGSKPQSGARGETRPGQGGAPGVGPAQAAISAPASALARARSESPTPRRADSRGEAVAEEGRLDADEPVPPTESPDGPLRIPSGRMDELMDLASELIVRRGVWAAQAERLKEFAALIRACRNELQVRLENLTDLGLGRGASADRGDIATVILRLAEQVEDLDVLTETAQAQAVPLADDSDTLARLTLQLWETLQSIRIVPVRGLLQRLARVAHDAARVERREVEVVMVGEETGLDRAVQDKAFEPLLHVVRNAVGHGIEAPADRLAACKPAVGRVTLEGRREGNTLVLSVQDDGRGLDYTAIAEKARRLGLLGADEAAGPEQLGALIFRSGFSTRDEAGAISGRGVGLDVVAQEVRRLRGTIDLTSQAGAGTRMTIRLPARLALEQAMITRVAGQAFAVPVSLIEHAQPFEPGDVVGTGNQATVRIRDHQVPLIVARETLGFPATAPASCPKLLLVRAEGGALALLFDEIEGTRELVIKPLGPLLAGHPVIWGTSLSLTGDVIFILNPSRLLRWLREGRDAALPSIEAVARPAPVLVVDDSISVRRVVTRQLRMLGLEVDEVSNGVEALGKLASRPYSMILTDLEMPRMDGFELLAELRRSPALAALPVIVASTESRPATRRRVLALGARAFVAKPIDQDELARVAGALLSGAV
jgi:chemotaxis protein histidine kinase CheA